MQNNKMQNGKLPNGHLQNVNGHLKQGKMENGKVDLKKHFNEWPNAAAVCLDKGQLDTLLTLMAP